jgi:hypothetical protein
VSTAEIYVVALDKSLVGPRRARREMVQEAHDHLDDAAAAYLRAGYDRAGAERMAVDDFGELDEIVPAFQTTLAVASARRTAWMLLVVLSIQPLLWDGPLGRHDHTHSDGLLFAILNDCVEYGGGLMIFTALVMLVATSLGNRWFSAGRGTARLASFTTIGAAMSLKVIGVAMVLLSNMTDPLSWLMVAAFLVVPLSVTASSARRTLAAC